MKREYIAGAGFFIMKQFFDIEREIIQQLWVSAIVKVHDYKHVLLNVQQLVLHKN